MTPPVPTTDAKFKNPTRAAKPTRVIFDPWNALSRGHQYAENKMASSPAWRDLRTARLGRQFGDDSLSGSRNKNKVETKVNLISDYARSHDGAVPLKKRRKIMETDEESKQKPNSHQSTLKKKADAVDEGRSQHDCQQNPRREMAYSKRKETQKASSKQIFRGLTFYINGSTYPLISDHKLKNLLVSHGGNLSIALARRTVTHVILGNPNCHDSSSKGTGGGLASGKIQKEITTTKSSNVKYVRAEWVIACLERGIRVPEAEFAPKVAVAGRGQRSALGMLKEIGDKENLKVDTRDRLG